jgi:putative toxin-antitoxin system antitoxin component (TIGR02293 family)
MTAAHLLELLGEPDRAARAELQGEQRPVALVDDIEVARAVERGLPLAALRRLTVADPTDGGLTPEEIERLVIPRRTLTKRRARRQPLSLEESNRLARLARVLTAAVEAFGGDPSDRTAESTREATRRAAVWLRRPSRALDGETPLALCTTDAGARIVEDELGRIAFGVFA